MKTLDSNQIEAVSGGVLPLLAILAFECYYASEIEDAVNGFFGNPPPSSK